MPATLSGLSGQVASGARRVVYGPMTRRRLATFALVFVATSSAARAQYDAPYVWRSVQMVGGGFVDGIVMHPTAADVRYARTDIGGAYRWDAATRRWQPLMDWVSYADVNLMGVESIAIDPADADRVYLACGTYTNARAGDGAILRSDDRGRTFQRTDLPLKFGGNEDGRGNGERLAVDPRDGRILYLGTRHDGLWRSADRGASWARVENFPDVTEPVPATPNAVPGETPQQRRQRMPVLGSGIVFVKFGSAAGTAKEPSTTIYVGVSLMNRPNLFVSTDGGRHWREVVGAPASYRPTRAALSSDGMLYIAYGNAPGPSRMTDGAVWKLDTRSGTWTDITPDKPAPGSREFGYAAVSVDAQHPGTLIASSFSRYRAGGEEIFRSTDGGTSWKPVFAGGGVYDYSLAPYVKSTGIHWLFDIEIDPKNSDHAMFTTGYGGWETFDLRAMDRGAPTHWSLMMPGIEETVALELVSPARGAPLVSAIGDYGGFVHWDLDRPAPEGAPAPPRFGNTTGVAAASLHPEVIVRVGIEAGERSGQNIGYSLDEGRSWQGTRTQPTPESRSGSIAVSADGEHWVWTPERASPFFTRDRGATWTASQGVPAGSRVVADPVDAQLFYALSLPDLTLYRSTDGAATFAAQRFELPEHPPIARDAHRGDNRGGQDRIYLAPGRTGDLWLAAFDGLYRANPPANGAGDRALTFRRFPGVEEIHAFGFGKAAPNRGYPAMYLVGTVRGQRGIFRSTDEGGSWVRINDDQHQWGLVLQITGDPKRFGRVYVGTHGRGTLYGDPR
jgi:photosystem II stability/assembly factor-like uncharacterized protein